MQIRLGSKLLKELNEGLNISPQINPRDKELNRALNQGT
jgi:hypothetical protein